MTKMTKKEIRRAAARYAKYVEWSDEDQCFIGRCPSLFEGGLHGREEASVYREVCETAEEWVGTLLADGTDLPRERSVRDYSGRFLVRIDPAQHQRLALKAQLGGKSLNAWVVDALSKA